MSYLTETRFPRHTSFLSTRANAYGRLNHTPAVKHVAGTGNWTLCGRRLADPYRVSSDSEHALCRRCEQKWRNS